MRYYSCGLSARDPSRARATHHTLASAPLARLALLDELDFALWALARHRRQRVAHPARLAELRARELLERREISDAVVEVFGELVRAGCAALVAAHPAPSGLSLAERTLLHDGLAA